jgi:hypothetical protein
MIGDRGTLQSQAPITIPPKSEPEPDFAIIKNRDDNYLSSHPQGKVNLVMQIGELFYQIK